MKQKHFPIWQEGDIMPAFPQLKENIKTEVTVVGGGITGITTAYLLAKKGVKVVLIDRGKLTNATTGHTTAKITAQHGIIYHEFMSHFSHEEAALYYESQSEALKSIRNIIQENQIECHFEEQDAILLTNNDKNRRKLEQEFEAYTALNIDREELTQLPVAFPMKYAIKMKNQAQFHPISYLKSLVDEIIENGGEIYENTSAYDIENADHRIVRTKDQHSIICDQVVIATQFPFFEGEAFYSARMYPSRSYAVAFTSKNPYPGGMYLDVDEPVHSLRTLKLDGEEYWIFGGQNHKTGQYKHDVAPLQKLKEFASKHLKLTDWQYEWSAQDYTTLDKLPYIGRLNKNRPEILVATGYRKWGMTNSMVAAKVLTDLILNKENPYIDLYRPTRFHADPDLKQFISTNTNVAKELVSGKLMQDKHTPKEIPAGSAIKTKQHGQTIGIYKDHEGKVHALDTTCTHLGCEVTWNDEEKTWDCPCHGSRFACDGKVIEGPALEDLKKVEYRK